MAKRPPKVHNLPEFPSKYTTRPTNFEQKKARRQTIYCKAHETEYDAICRQVWSNKCVPNWQFEIEKLLYDAGWTDKQIVAKFNRLNREGHSKEKKMDKVAEELGIPMRRVDRWINHYITGNGSERCWSCRTNK